MTSAPETGAIAQTPARSPRQANGTPRRASSSRRQRAPKAKNQGSSASTSAAPTAIAQPPAPAATAANVEVPIDDEAEDERDATVGGLAGGVDGAQVQHGAARAIRRATEVLLLAAKLPPPSFGREAADH